MVINNSYHFVETRTETCCEQNYVITGCVTRNEICPKPDRHTNADISTEVPTADITTESRHESTSRPETTTSVTELTTTPKAPKLTRKPTRRPRPVVRTSTSVPLTTQDYYTTSFPLTTQVDNTSIGIPTKLPIKKFNMSEIENTTAYHNMTVDIDDIKTDFRDFSCLEAYIIGISVFVIMLLLGILLHVCRRRRSRNKKTYRETTISGIENLSLVEDIGAAETEVSHYEQRHGLRERSRSKSPKKSSEC